MPGSVRAPAAMALSVASRRRTMTAGAACRTGTTPASPRAPRRAALALLLACAACATPVGVHPASERTVRAQMAASALSSNYPSLASKRVLQRLNLAQRFADDPRGALAELHAGLGQADEMDRLFALAELSYLYAAEHASKPYFLAAAAYAYAFAFPPDPSAAPDCYDPRLRSTLDLYNSALTAGLAEATSPDLNLAARDVALPFATLRIVADPDQATRSGYRFEHFIPTSSWEVRGLRNRYWRPGIGVPVVARAAPGNGAATRRRLGDPTLYLTVVLRFADPRRAMSEGALHAAVELYEPDVTTDVHIGAYTVPLEGDISGALAKDLDGAPVWDTEIAGFRRGDFRPLDDPNATQLLMLYPYRPGRIPVVLVHGTASSPARWAEMVNEILGDPHLAARVQLWAFTYNSGNPVALSGLQLREALRDALAELDPEGRDPALRQMVIIGHSQGGLLTKTLVVSSGNRFWENISATPFEQAQLDEETRQLFQRGLFIEPLPSVRRVVFIATPHHGSFLADDLLGRIARSLVSLPSNITRATLQVATLQPGKAARSLVTSPTSIDNMQASNPFLRTLAELPIAGDVHAHSIVAVKGEEAVEEGDDGVVAYSSAHLDGVDSELVVRSGHSTQSEPATIEEVRRILYLHLAEVDGDPAAASPAATRAVPTSGASSTPANAVSPTTP